MLITRGELFTSESLVDKGGNKKDRSAYLQKGGQKVSALDSFYLVWNSTGCPQDFHHQFLRGMEYT